MDTRKFVCPFCTFTKNFYGNEAKKFRKRVAGFTCPNCQRKVTDKDIRRIKGRGPKPKGERRKRVKKEPVVDTTPFVVHPNVDQFDWRTSGPPPPGERQRLGRAGWLSRAPQPTTRTLEEVVVVAHQDDLKRSRPR